MASVTSDKSHNHLIIQLKADLIENDGALLYKEFRKLFYGETQKNPKVKSSCSSFVKKYKGHFALDQGQVNLKTELALCPDHCTERGCPRNESCPQLHMCRFYLLHRCRFQKFSGTCKFGHNLDDPHTKSLLIKHVLRGLSVEQLRVVFRNNRSSATIPHICKFYNVGDCKKGKSCSHLHLCKGYVMGNCKFGSKCKQSHNVDDWEVHRILTNYGYKMDDAVLLHLKKDYVQHFKEKQDDVKICPFNLFENQKCRYGNNCENIHSSTPYAWQVKQPSSHAEPENVWEDLPKESNKDIYLSFVDPSKDTCVTKVAAGKGKTIEVKVDFEKMVVLLPGNREWNLRLITTPSSAKSFNKHATDWHWFWYFDEAQKWEEYGHATTCDCSPSDIDSNKIEEAFQENPEQILSFKTSHERCKLDLAAMVQTNMRTGKERLVKRRPGLTTPAQSPAGATPIHKTIPAHWKQSTPSSTPSNFERVEISHTGDTAKEWAGVAALFGKTMSCKIKKVSRIQNEELWEDFSRKKERMEKRLSGQLNEKQLFHGTRQQHIDAICQQGFDWRVCGSSSGTAYGKGSYFARDAHYSSKYTDSHQMFLVRVLVGEPCVGHRTYVRPPEKSEGVLYDSCVNSLQNPQKFVIFENSQVYPEYLIEY